MHIKQLHMHVCFGTKTHCLRQLSPIHRHHNPVVWIWERLKVPVGHFVKYRRHHHSPVLNMNCSTCII